MHRTHLSRKRRRARRARARRSHTTARITNTARTRITKRTSITPRNSIRRRSKCNRRRLCVIQLKICKKGSQAAPLFVLLRWVVSEASPVVLRWFRERHAPHARCDQLVICSKPGGVISLFPWLVELTFRVYACVAANSREIFKGKNTKRLLWKSYFTKSDSRSWSRPTNDFTVRKRLKRSWISRF